MKLSSASQAEIQSKVSEGYQAEGLTLFDHISLALLLRVLVRSIIG